MQAPTTIRLSPSMDSVVASLSSQREITAWDILRALLSTHTEYGGGIAKGLLGEQDVPVTHRKHIGTWIAELNDLFDADTVPELHGRLVVLGLCRLDPQLRKFLDERGLPDAIRSELEENFESLLRAPDILYPGATSDHVERGAADLLGIEQEVRTIAHVITSKRVKPPLSLGLFGDWGTGKTFFITKLQEYVSGIADHYAAVERDTDEVSEWCTRIVQIEFNAWHYSDSNLWATLVSRIHEELRREIRPDEELKHRMEERVRDAEAEERRANEELQAARKRVAAASETLAAAQQAVAAKQNTLNGFVETLRNLLRSDDAVQRQLEQAANAFGAPHAAEAYGALEELHGTLATTSGRAWAVAKSMLGAPQLALLVVAVIAAPWAIGWLLEASQPALGAVAQTVIEISTIVIGGAGWLTRYIRRGSKHLEAVEHALATARSARQKEIRENVAAEAAARELAVARSEEEGARVVLDAARTELQQVQTELIELNPERRLFRLLEERSRSGAYTKHLGIISLIREDFETISDLLIEMEAERSTTAKPAPIQRIILYIDDLDRCRADRVVEVLEAVHMLLAFPIFTVVVGVDPRWLRQSLLERYPRNLSATGNEDKHDLTASTPQNYLEKIFQIPFALRRVEQRGYEQLVSSLLEPPEGLLRNSSDGRAAADHGLSPAPAAAGTGTISGTVTNTVSIIPSAARQLEFTRQEKSDIAKLWSLFTTPRSVKRFINTYRLLRVGIPADRRRAFEQGEYRIPLMLLAVVTSSPNEMYVFQAELRAWAAGLDARARKRTWTLTGLLDALREPITQQDRDWPAIDAAVRTSIRSGFDTSFAVETLLSWADRVARYSFAVMPERAATPSAPRRRATDHGGITAQLKRQGTEPPPA